MHNLPYEFTSRKVSPWGGIKFFQQTYVRSGMKEAFEKVGLPGGGSNRAYDSVDLVEGFMTSVVLGARRMAHSGMLRTDEVIREIFGWKKGMASQSTFSRFFSRFNQNETDRIFHELMCNWWSQIGLDKMTIDVDSTVITRHGNQEGAKIGYNPSKKGHVSHHPLMAFCSELNMVVDAWMRPGNTSDSNNMECFLDNILTILTPQRVGILRADRGFYDYKIMHQLEQSNVPYIIKARLSERLISAIVDSKDWYSDSGREYTAIEYQGVDWDKSRRIIAVRIPKIEKDKASLSLFEDEKLRTAYQYAAYVTTSTLSAREVQRCYDGRGDCENRIRELKYDYGIDGFAMHSIAATEAAFRLIMITYNIMALFKQKAMLTVKGKYLSTIRFQCIAIGSYMVSSGRKRTMKLSAEGKRRHFLEQFFSNVENLEAPFNFSNA